MKELELIEIKREISELNEERGKLRAKWQSEKKIVEDIQSEKQKIENRQ